MRGGGRRNFESRGRGRNTQTSERPSPTFDPNKYCEVCDKTGHLPNECFVVARFQRAAPFVSKQSVQAHKTIQQTPAQQTPPPQQSYPPMYPPYPYMYPNPQAYMMHHPPPTGLPQITQGQTGVAPQQTQAPTRPGKGKPNQYRKIKILSAFSNSFCHFSFPFANSYRKVSHTVNTTKIIPISFVAKIA